MSLILLIVFTFLTRFWGIETIPPILSPSFVSLRYFSALQSILHVLFLYWIVSDIWKRRKIGLLTAWIFSVSYWSIEQGRIASPVHFPLTLLLFGFCLVRLRRSILPFFGWVSLLSGALLGVRMISFSSLPDISTILSNIFVLISFDLLFFKNTTFWWGGIREVGVFSPAFLPFFLFGVYSLFFSSRWWIGLWILLPAFLSSFDQHFPETRLFFLSLPIFSLILSLGIDGLFRRKGKFWNVFVAALFLFFLYDFSAYLHFYSIHYPINILSHAEKITGPF